MAVLGGFEFSLFDLIIFGGIFLVAFFFVYNKSLKSVEVWARLFYDNGTSEDLDAKELFDENRIEATKTTGAGIFSRNKKENDIVFSREMKGLPYEHRLGATKRARFYYITQSGSTTININDIDPGLGDPVNQIIRTTGGTVRQAQIDMAQSENKGLKNMLPGIFMGAGLTFGLIWFLGRIWPGVFL